MCQLRTLLCRLAIALRSLRLLCLCLFLHQGLPHIEICQEA